MIDAFLINVVITSVITNSSDPRRSVIIGHPMMEIDRYSLSRGSKGVCIVIIFLFGRGQFLNNGGEKYKQYSLDLQFTLYVLAGTPPCYYVTDKYSAPLI